MTYVPAVMPYIPGLLQQVFIGAVPTRKVFTRIPADFLRRMPFLLVSIYGTATEGDERFLTRCVAQVDSFAPDDPGAHELAEEARACLLAAQVNQIRYARGVVNRVATTSQPAPLRLSDDPDAYARWSARYRLTIRP